jgi:hypothetical protein
MGCTGRVQGIPSAPVHVSPGVVSRAVRYGTLPSTQDESSQTTHQPRIRLHIRLQVVRVVLPDGARDRGPGRREREDALDGVAMEFLRGVG